MWQRIVNAADAAAYWIGDRITDWTGYAALSITLEQATRPREVTLGLPGYMQLNTYLCGAITAAMIVRYFRPRMSFARIYAAVDPLPASGANESQMIQALRSCGLRVGIRAQLRFRDLRNAIDRQRPVMVHIINPGAEYGHWVTVYGYGLRPDRVFLAINGRPRDNPTGWVTAVSSGYGHRPATASSARRNSRPVRLTRSSR